MQDPTFNDTSTSELVIVDQAETSLEVAKAKERIRYFIGLSLSDNTKKVYASGWKQFVEYCGERGFSSMPASPETVSFFVIHLADEGRKISTIISRLAAIKKAHEFKKLPSPTDDIELKTVLSGIRREKKVAPNRKSALITADIQRMVLALPPKLIGVRNKALLLVGFAGGFRRSELAGG